MYKQLVALPCQGQDPASGVAGSVTFRPPVLCVVLICQVIAVRGAEEEEEEAL